MFNHVDMTSDVAVYIQIENLVQFAIASGGLKAGDRLPPTVKLAEKLGINFNTVAKAYRDLEQILQKEFSAQPQQETTDLFNSLTHS